MKSKSNLELLALRVYPEQLKAIDKLIKKHPYAFYNRSHYIRVAIVQKLRKDLNRFYGERK